MRREISSQKAVYERASNRYKLLLIKDRGSDDEGYDPSDDEIYERMPRCLQVFNDTDLSEKVVEYKVHDQERVKVMDPQDRESSRLADSMRQRYGAV